MGLVIQSYLHLALPIAQKDLFTEKLSTRRCVRGHMAQSAEHLYCPLCGYSYKEQAEWRPTAAYEAYAQFHQMRMDRLWDPLLPLELLFVEGAKLHQEIPRVLCLDTERPSDTEEVHQFGFGLTLRCLEAGEGRAGRVLTSEWEQKRQLIRQAAEQVGIHPVVDPALYLQLYVAS